ncbi:hypothetical protein D9758_016481 [Tetrapyrgos nigripes]|uniref:Uncharacterized protein n=1 Tax=Tetrapyrgos nigripes TaxID=182062 RepID=A0A8H5CMK7_9AGAR|nr:hypothetical protein D9758_016481 [Tetrapyrgos nigripes]
MPPRKTSSCPTPSPAPLPAPAPPADGNWDLYTGPLYLAQRPLRLTHLCPYISTFVSYLFHEETHKWLDVMVSSSLQPHSVRDMVGRVFGSRSGDLESYYADEAGGASRGGGEKLGSGSGEAEPHAPENEKTKENKPGLIAVWARDTLDLESKTLLPPLHLRPPLTLATPLAPRLALTLTTTTTTTAPSSFPASASEEKGLHPTIYLANTPTPTTYYPNASTNAPPPIPPLPPHNPPPRRLPPQSTFKTL